jgi:hypothetical protein
MGKIHKIRFFVGVYNKHGYVWVFCHVPIITEKHVRCEGSTQKVSVTGLFDYNWLYIYVCLICELLNEQ